MSCDESAQPETSDAKSTYPAGWTDPEPNWFAIQQAYIHGHLKGTTLAVKCHVNYGTLKDHMRRERWRQSRKEYRALQAAHSESELIEVRTRAEASLDQNTHDAGTALMGRVFQMAIQEENLSRLSAGARAIQTLYPLLRTVDGLPPEKINPQPPDPHDGVFPIKHCDEGGEPYWLDPITKKHVDPPSWAVRSLHAKNVERCCQTEPWIFGDEESAFSAETIIPEIWEGKAGKSRDGQAERLADVISILRAAVRPQFGVKKEEAGSQKTIRRVAPAAAAAPPAPSRNTDAVACVLIPPMTVPA